MIIGIAGAVAGKVVRVRTHPRGEFIWLADVCLVDGGDPVQIVFGGELELQGGELVPVAPPGSWAFVQREGSTDVVLRKMRTRKYRGERSHGMLCSLDELGWICGGPNEVAILCNLAPGRNLDTLPCVRWPEYVKGWQRAKGMEEDKKMALAALAAEVDDALKPAIRRPARELMTSSH
jgi:tRNA-binding EMAP/Myf-like protein